MTKKKVIVPEHIDESGIKVLEASNLVETIYYDDKSVSPDVYTGALDETFAVLVRIKDFNR